MREKLESFTVIITNQVRVISIKKRKLNQLSNKEKVWIHKEKVEKLMS